MFTWSIITGEYPPQLGGVADYTEKIARGLTHKGYTVRVFFPADENTITFISPLLTLYGVAHFHSLDGLKFIEKQLHQIHGPQRILFQYVPQMYGCLGANAPWIASFCNFSYPVDVMFHEVRHGVSRQSPWRYHLLNPIQEIMASLLYEKANRSFVSIPRWADLLHRLSPKTMKAIWLPIPSNINVQQKQSSFKALDQQDSFTVGHFSTYSPEIQNAIKSWLQLLPSNFQVKLFGRGSKQFLSQINKQEWNHHKKILCFDDLNEVQLSQEIQTCQLMYQPYPLDGITTRRTTAMACIALGVPLITNLGSLSEPLWEEYDLIIKAQTPHEAIEHLTHFSKRSVDWQTIALNAATFYEKFFSIENTLSKLTQGLSP
jgi:hypothetical protein